MTNAELYINGVLVDIGRDLGVRLNRQLLNPGELNTKDAQYSYAISLPATPVNHAAFNYAHVEETKNKFNREYRAEYYVSSVRIFAGNFRLSSIDRNGYKGNLYIPALKSIRDIFGDLKLNENPEYRIEFGDFSTSVSFYNNKALTDGPQMAIFPYVLYGVLPKTPLNRNANFYSPRASWDDTVRIGLQDLPPSINPLLMLRHIFQAQGYNLQGDAFDDEKLARLYMSYKNPDDYVQPWNYGQHAKIQINGVWSSRENKRNGAPSIEQGIFRGSDPTGEVYAVDLFDTINADITVTEDTGGNVIRKLVLDTAGAEWQNVQVRIPTSGFYKIRFGASLNVNQLNNWRYVDSATGIQHIGDETEHADNNFLNNVYEIRLCRDRKSAEFGLSSPKINNTYYYNNQPQNETFNDQNVPKYFPPVNSDGQINFVDLAQDPKHLLGFALGTNSEPDYVTAESTRYKNPLDTTNNKCSITVAKPAISWQASENTQTPTRLAVDAPGYMKYGLIGNFDNPGDNPDGDIDYSGGTFIQGMVLDANGNAVAPGAGNLTDRTPGYYVHKNGGYYAPDSSAPVGGWELSALIDLRRWTGLTLDGGAQSNPDAAIIAYYDINLQYLGAGLTGPAVNSAVSYAGEPIAAPAPNAVYAVVSTNNGMNINGTDVAVDNIILDRFPLDRFYTYTLTTDPLDNYQGFAYIRLDGLITGPFMIVPFVNGVAEFSTANLPFGAVSPTLTMYLRTPDFDVSSSSQNTPLIISRRIDTPSQNVIDWEQTDKYKIQLNNAPANYLRKGEYDGTTGLEPWNNGQGEVNAVVWLEAGELLTVAAVSSEGRYRESGMHSAFGFVAQDVTFNLSIQPFRVDKDWLKVSLSGNGTAPMDWNDPVNFDTTSINVVGFLNKDMKTDDFIDNFCKAFNLRLSQINANTFRLDVRQSKKSISNRFITLDDVTAVDDRTNTPLGLPSLYKIGFTVDKDEEGYDTTGDDGGGSFETGITEENIVEQKSNFSFNWFKQITKTEPGGAIVLPLPVISKKDVWAPSMSYLEAMGKKYTDQPYRFWYFDGLLNDLGASFAFNGGALQLAKVSNKIEGLSILNYKNQPFTILGNYFTLLINGASHYTEVEGYLTPLQYAALDGSIMAMFNGDLYYIAEISAYDPNARNKTKLKLIRKI